MSRPRKTTAMMRMLAATALLAVNVQGASDTRSCYYEFPRGNIANSNFVPCNNGNTSAVSMCCNYANGDECTPEGVCISGSNSYWRDFCTDPTWQAPECVSLCPGVVNPRLDFCGDGSYCCWTGDDTSCCANSTKLIATRAGTSAVPLTLAADSTATDLASMPAASSNSASTTPSTSSPSSAAAILATTSSSTTTSTPVSKAASGNTSSSSNGVAIGVGVGVGVAALLAIIAALAFWYRGRQRKRNIKELEARQIEKNSPGMGWSQDMDSTPSRRLPEGVPLVAGGEIHEIDHGRKVFRHEMPAHQDFKSPYIVSPEI